ncbi:hypothetical protein BUALT_Bualt16G0118700 [Buddleja alternifolia]|uniref:TFIIB-type domain-containing protein n=1 Tax=Buddleja alternifolia TaxID=168488 RepID=A0AAV6WBM8_9LAMI|nr:hypothetical protein BUALT_Bualt16G0118700 [Buddleja alternifolia]
MSDLYCSDCKRMTEVVSDHSAGDTVCSECGLVLEARSIDESSEWRIFADDSGDHDPNRVGGPVNPLLGDAALSTVISRSANGSNADPSLSRLQNRGGDPDRAIVFAFKTIANMADRLSLVTTIKDRASEIYKRLEDQKCTRGRNLEALVAACIYIACRQEGKPRTVKEVKAVQETVQKAGDFDISFWNRRRWGGERKHFSLSHRSRYLDFPTQKTCLLFFYCRRSPISIAAAIIFMITQLSDSKKPLRDISIATTVAEGTIKNAYRDLYPHAAKIIPEWYAKDRDLKNLSSPKPNRRVSISRIWDWTYSCFDYLSRSHALCKCRGLSRFSASNPKKNIRGCTRGIALRKLNKKNNNEKLVIHIDPEQGRPVDSVESAKLSRELGQISRESLRVPIKWKDLDREDFMLAFDQLDMVLGLVSYVAF